MTGLNNGPDSVSSVLKVFGILQSLAEQKDIGVTELSQRLMMSKSTTYRFLQTMKSLGYVHQAGDSDKYGLSLKLFELGARAIEYQDLIRIADKQMAELGRQTKETLHLGTLDEDSIIYLHKIDAEYNLQMYSRIGRRRPLYSTALGKIMLAWLNEAEVRVLLKDVNFVRYTERTLPDVDALLNELARVREFGYAEDNEEMESGLRCLGVPIYDRLGHIIAGVSISLPMVRFDDADKMVLVEKLHRTAAAISDELGCHHYPFLSS